MQLQGAVMGETRNRKLTPGRWWRMLDRTSQQILVALVGVAVASVIPAVIISGDWAGLFLNLGTELAGASITFVLLDQILGTSRTKSSLLAQMGSRMNDEATRAVEELRRMGWLSDGVLRGADLAGANLQSARLYQAALPRAVLEGAKLQHAVLGRADLQGADLTGADLTGANLWRARLQGTRLYDANLQGAILDQAEFDEETYLPDRSHWTPGIDLRRFTDPAHPDFWRSDYSWSPAFGGTRRVVAD